MPGVGGSDRDHHGRRAADRDSGSRQCRRHDGLAGQLAGKEPTPDLHERRGDLLFPRRDRPGQRDRPGSREGRQNLRQPEEVVRVGMRDVDIAGIGAPGLHPRRQLSAFLFCDQAVDEQGAAVVADESRGGWRPRCRASGLLKCGYRARDRLGVDNEDIEVKAHRFMLAGRRGGRYPQDDCSCLSGALARRGCDQGLVRLERARELRPPPHRRREAPAAQAHHQDIHQLLVTEHGASGISYSTVRDYIAPRPPLLPPPAGVPSEPPGPYDDRMADEAGGRVPVTRRQWDERMSAWFERYAHPRWAAAEPYWGMWCIPQSRLPVLPADPAGAAAVELGGGSAYVSAWLARRGARPVGVDVSARQLATARRLQAEFGLRFPLVHADAEQAPLASACADLVVSEYGASLWCDPHRWLPEAARLLRPGGRLVFMAESTLARMCLPEKGPAPARLGRG